MLSDGDRDNLVANIVGHLSDEVEPEIQRRAVEHWRLVDADLGERIAGGLGSISHRATRTRGGA